MRGGIPQLWPVKAAKGEARLAELDRRLDEAHNGYAPKGPYKLKMARERGELRRELRSIEDRSSLESIGREDDG